MGLQYKRHLKHFPEQTTTKPTAAVRLQTKNHVLFQPMGVKSIVGILAGFVSHESLQRHS